MEGEINNLILVWTTVVASLCYCHAMGKIFPTGNLRRLTILPVILIFLCLPLNLTSVNFGATTSFLISWLATFKLILFAFNKGPLSSNPPIPLSRFIPLACFPIEVQHITSTSSTKKNGKTPLIYFAKVLFLASLIRVYVYKKYIHQNIMLLFYCFYIYFALEIIVSSFAAVGNALYRVELKPQFDKPYTSTSLQDFWGRRWNLMVSNSLNSTVYQPVKFNCARFLSRKWASIPAVLATFVVSGLMHELVFYHIGRMRPTWEVMWFFVLHGVCLCVEIVAKKMLNGRFKVPGIVSGVLAQGFVIYTSFLLFFPPFLRGNVELRVCREYLAFIEFVKSGRLVSPDDISCPFL